MSNVLYDPPVILCIAGHDPSGGAGVQADIETLAAHGCHAVSAISCLTVQDTANVQQVLPVAPETLAAQIETLCADFRVSVVKVGLIGHASLVPIIGAVARALEVPLVLDPVLAAGGGKELASDRMVIAIRELLPTVTLATPNRAEARRLSGYSEPDAAAERLLDQGCQSVLLTGADEAQGSEVVNCLYRKGRPAQKYRWPRLPGTFHGSGCTLASACAAHLARGEPIEQAVTAAQRYTLAALEQAHALGRGQKIPWRRSK